MDWNHSKKRGVATVILMALVALPALAANDVQGRFDGKVACVNGRKQAEFKTEGVMTAMHSSSQDIKRRIDTLTWHRSGEGSSFSDREKEKIELQHALKMLHDLSCDGGSDSATTPDTPAEPPALSSHRH